METVFENQEKRILEHLKKGDTITPIEALNKFNCMRLSDRIFQLRRKGHAISTLLVKEGNKQYARYKLERS